MPERYLQTLPESCVSRMDPARTGQRLSAFIQAAQVHEATAKMNSLGYFLEDITGFHVIEGIELDYHFDHFVKQGRVSLRCIVFHDHPKVASVTDIFPGADWHEREVADFFGVIFLGHPNPKPLLMPENSTLRPLLREPEARRSIRSLLPPSCFIQESFENPEEPKQ